MSPLRANRRGTLALTGSMACYSVSDVLTKLAAQKYPYGEVLAVRGFLTIAIMLVVIAALGQLRFLRPALTPPILIRSMFEASASGMYVAALIHMPIANTAAVVMTSPLILTALSVFFYAEQVGWRRWTAISVGFVGVLFILKPTPSAFDAWALLALGAGFCGACRELMTRRVDPSVPTLVVAFMSVVALTLVGCAVGLTEQWRPMEWRELGYLSVSACFFSVAVYLIVLAFRGTDFSVVAPFRYTFLLWAAIVGYIIFREVPDGWSMLGAGLIVGSGLYALHREVVRRRAVAAQASAAP